MTQDFTFKQDTLLTDTLKHLDPVPNVVLSFLDYPSHMIQNSTKLYNQYFEQVLIKKRVIIETEDTAIISMQVDEVNTDDQKIVKRVYDVECIGDMFRKL